MATDIMKFSRRFQMWAYTVGHGQLLLRSPKATDLPTRIDVLFKNVAAVCLPTILDGLIVSEPTEGEKTELPDACDPSWLEGRKVLRFVDHTSKYVRQVLRHEDEHEYNEPAFQVNTRR